MWKFQRVSELDPGGNTDITGIISTQNRIKNIEKYLKIALFKYLCPSRQHMSYFNELQGCIKKTGTDYGRLWIWI